MVNGQPTDIQVEPVYSPNGEIESFRPVSAADSDRLEQLTGATIMSSEEANESDTTAEGNETTSPLDEPIPSTGDSDLDELMDGTIRNPNTNEAHANQNLQTPVSKDEFEEGLREIAGEKNVLSHSGNGVRAELGDGTVIQIYPERSIDG